MQYTMLGKTNLRVSRLGFGAMRLPMCGEGENQRIDRDKAIPMILHAFENGVNYIDTAVGYCNRDSQRVVGEALKCWSGGNIVVSTKNHCYDDEKQWWTHLEDSLERLQVPCIDIYNTHGVTWQRYVDQVEPAVSKWLAKARDQGLIKHICTSFHDSNAALIKVVDTGFYESVTLQYNMLDRTLEEGIAHARAKGLGVVVMGPVGGGRLGEPSGELQRALARPVPIPELAMRFVLANPAVDVALSGMSTLEQVIDNLRTCSDPVPLSAADHQAIEDHLLRLRKMADLYCTGCGYCMPCPEGIPISRIFDQYNKGRVYGLWEASRRNYAAIGANPWSKGKKADACTECGACEKKCPQNIPIRKQLKGAHAALSGRTDREAV